MHMYMHMYMHMLQTAYHTLCGIAMELVGALESTVAGEQVRVWVCSGCGLGVVIRECSSCRLLLSSYLVFALVFLRTVFHHPPLISLQDLPL